MKLAYKICVSSILILSIAFCKSSPTSPIDGNQALLELTQILETQNFIFYYSPGDFVYAERSEAFHEWAVSFLNVSCPKKIEYYKYKDREQQKRITGSTSTGWAITDSFEVHTSLPWMNHECTHLYTSLIGRPSIFFNEGIAVALQVDPYNNDFVAREKNGEPIHSIVKRYKNEGVLYPVENIIDLSGFTDNDYIITYPEAGSFVRYLLDTYGITNLKAIFTSVSRYDSKEVIKDKFLSIYGISVAEVEAEWLIFLDNFNK